MKATSVVFVSAFALSLVSASDARAQAPTCETVEFSPAVLERAPDVRELCTRIEQRPSGDTFAVVEAEVRRVYKTNAVQVRFKLRDGTTSKSRYFRTPPERRVLVEGKPTRIQDLVVGQELTLWIDVKTPRITPEPLVADEPLELLPIETEAPAEEVPEVAAGMPKTSSPLPWLSLWGMGFLLIAASLRYLRRS